jgi:outer membrane protein assembly factor BamD
MSPWRYFGFALLLTGCAHRRVPVHVSTTALEASPKALDSIWAAAVDNYQHHHWDKAAAGFERLELEISPSDRRALQGRLYLGELYTHQGSNLQAVREFRRLVDDYPSDSLAPEALLLAGNSYRGLWRGPELDDTYGHTAQSVYAELIARYPQSPAATKAQAQVADLDNLFAMKAYRTGNYYFKLHAYDSAILYYKQLVLDYPKTPVVPVALGELLAVYRKLGYDEDIRTTCTYMQGSWASTPQYKVGCSGSATPAAAEKPAGG